MIARQRFDKAREIARWGADREAGGNMAISEEVQWARWSAGCTNSCRHAPTVAGSRSRSAPEQTCLVGAELPAVTPFSLESGPLRGATRSARRASRSEPRCTDPSNVPHAPPDCSNHVRRARRSARRTHHAMRCPGAWRVHFGDAAVRHSSSAAVLSYGLLTAAIPTAPSGTCGPQVKAHIIEPAAGEITPG